MNENDLRRLTLRSPRRLTAESLLRAAKPASRWKETLWAGLLTAFLVGSLFWKRSDIPAPREILTTQRRNGEPALVERTREIQTYFAR